MRTFLRWLGGMLLALASCQVTSRPAGHKAAVRANTMPAKHALTESPTLERAAPTVQPEQ